MEEIAEVQEFLSQSYFPYYIVSSVQMLKWVAEALRVSPEM